MKKVKLKKPAFYGICAGTFALLLGGLYYADLSHANLYKNKGDEDFQYVSRLFGNDEVPVVSAQTTVMRPYTDENVKVVQNFYNYKGTEKEQENSITKYDQTYIQNNGVAYGGIKADFDVVSASAGTVINVKQDKLLGNIVEIQNTDKVITVYQSLSEVTVKQNDAINQGDVIGKSGQSNMNKDLGSHVLFEVKVNGVYVNPEECYDKDINSL